MSKEAETKLEEWSIWWDQRVREGMSLEKKVAVQTKMIGGLFDILAYFLRDLRKAEGRRDNIGSGSIWLPNGFIPNFADKKQRDPDDSEQYL